MSNSRELVRDRLATTDATGKRVYLYPAEVKGRFRKLRNALSGVLLFVFLGLPWVQIAGHPAVLLDIPRRRFSLFGITFWGHDTPMLFFVFGGFALTLAFVTATWGRLWCGWACPQTVFTDMVFRRIERWIEGDALARRKLDASEWTLKKALLKTVKWFSFLAATLVITHSFLAYFIGVEDLSRIVRGSPAEHPTAFGVMLFATGIILFDFGWFREQFCAIACPYGRFQSVLMDERSLVVGYHYSRGEPRKGGEPLSGQESAKKGDCVNCYRCVQVCPTGIDIRRGVQMECVACTACIDACDDVMSRLGKQTGLISYTTLSKLETERTGAQGTKLPWFSLRSRIYLTLIIVFFSGIVITTLRRKPLDYTVLRYKGAPYEVVKAADGTDRVTNHFQIDLSNQTFDKMEVHAGIDSAASASGIEFIMPLNPQPVDPGVTKRIDFFVRFPRSLLQGGSKSISIQMKSTETHPSGELRETQYQEVIRLVGPLL